MNSATLDSAADEVMGHIVDEYFDRRGRGETPDIDEYARRHPELAAVLRQMLPALEIVHASGAGPNGRRSKAGDVLHPEGPLGDFRLVREIGRGGMGVVYEAVQISLGRDVALKVLPFAAALDAKQLQRFKNEAQAAAGLHHTNIVPVYAVGCERGVHYYAMQFIEGQTLAQVIAELHPAKPERKAPAPIELAPGAASSPSPPYSGERGWGEGAEPPDATTPHPQPLSPEYRGEGSPEEKPAAETATQARLSTLASTSGRAFFHAVARLGIQAAEALDYSHELGVIHRDIKPANMLVDGRGKLWITDFGLAHCQSQVGLTMTGDLVGTLRYMSPEQALAKRVLVDHRTDVYSLGATLYELLTGEPVFGGGDRQELLRQIAFEDPKTLRRHNKAIPAELNTIVLKALEKNPADRYATAKEMAEDLERFDMGDPIRARRPSLTRRIRGWCRRHRLIMTSITAIIVTSFLLGGSALWLRDRERGDTAHSASLDLEEAAASAATENWNQAIQALERAKGRLEGRGMEAMQNLVSERLRQFVQLKTQKADFAFYEHRRPALIAKTRSKIERAAESTALFSMYLDLGTHIYEQAKLPEAEAAYCKAIEIDSDNSEALHNLGNTLYLRQKYDAAAKASQEAIRIKPVFANAHNTLSHILRAQQRIAEADLEQDVANHQDYSKSIANHGYHLMTQGRFTEALKAFNETYYFDFRNWALRFCELDAKLPAVLNGEIQFTRAAEAFSFAELCRHPAREYYVASARFYAEAFALYPPIISDLRADIRYDAACAAARAGCGLGNDAIKLESREYARLRNQSLVWLRADLNGWRSEFEASPSAARNGVLYEMHQWQQSVALAGLRSPEGLAKLLESERTEWQKLWEDVAALEQKAAAVKPGVQHPK